MNHSLQLRRLRGLLRLFGLIVPPFRTSYLHLTFLDVGDMCMPARDMIE
jgi:hypothetical protein